MISGLGVYPVMAAGYFSNSKYALLGSTRAVAQRISYEVVIALLLLGVLYLCGSMIFQNISVIQTEIGVPLFLFIGPIFIF